MSKRILIIGLTLGLLAGALAMPAEAKKKKKKPPAPPAPVATVMYMEGTSQAGEQDNQADGKFLQLTKDPGTGEKSMGFWGAATSPNPNCAGNGLLPVFVGGLSGKVVGSLKVTFSAASTPGNSVEVRVWPDIAAQACNESYIEPAGKVTVPLPAGEGTVEATIDGLDFSASGLLMIQINPIGIPPGYARVFYGTDASKVEFMCVPAAGASCLP